MGYHSFYRMKYALELTDLVASLVMTTREDCVRLDGPTVDQVREIFKI